MAQKKKAPAKKKATSKKSPGAGSASGKAGLPHQGEMEKAFGVDLEKFDVRTHHDGFKPSAIGAKAYAGGEKVAFKGGADASQGMIGHEAAHIVQQRAGVR